MRGGEAGAGHVGGVAEPRSSAAVRERGAVGAASAGRADQHHVAAEPVGPRGGEFGADQQAREPRPGAVGREAGEQALGAEAEEPPGEALGARQRLARRPRRSPASDQPSASTEWRSTEAVASSAKISPVMKRGEADHLAGADCTHLVWVPGRQATPSKPGSRASRPAIWVSSPRITSRAGPGAGRAGCARRAAGRRRRGGRSRRRAGRAPRRRPPRSSPAARRPCRRRPTSVRRPGAEPGADEREQRRLEVVAGEAAHAGGRARLGQRPAVGVHRPGAQVRACPSRRRSSPRAARGSCAHPTDPPGGGGGSPRRSLAGGADHRRSSDVTAAVLLALASTAAKIGHGQPVAHRAPA